MKNIFIALLALFSLVITVPTVLVHKKPVHPPVVVTPVKPVAVNHPAINGTIVFSAFGSDNVKHIYTVTGSNALVQLTSGPLSDETPEWSPDGTRITFHRDAAQGCCNGASVYVMNADGSGLTDLSPAQPNLGDILPSFSADGKMVFFTNIIKTGANICPGAGLPAIASVVAMNSTDGSGRVVLVDGTTLPICANFEPQVSLNGQYIVWSCQGSIGQQDCRINVGTGMPGFLELTAGPGIFGDPHWRWDSQMIVVSRLTPDNFINLWTMSPTGMNDGGQLTQITHYTTLVGQVGHFASDPGYSPDGSQIVFEDATNLASTDPLAPAQLAIVDVATGVVTDLGIPCSNSGCGPRFKP